MSVCNGDPSVRSSWQNSRGKLFSNNLVIQACVCRAKRFGSNTGQTTAAASSRPANGSIVTSIKSRGYVETRHVVFSCSSQKRQLFRSRPAALECQTGRLASLHIDPFSGAQEPI